MANKIPSGKTNPDENQQPKGLSQKPVGDADSYKAPNQRREKVDGLTSQQNIGRNTLLDSDDEQGLDKHPTLKEKQGIGSGRMLSKGAEPSHNQKPDVE